MASRLLFQPASTRQGGLARVWLMTAGHLSIDSYPALLFALLPLFIARFHISYAQAGLLTTVVLGIGSVGQVPFGYVHDRVPALPTAALGLTLTAAAMSSIGFAGSYEMLLVLAAVAGLGSAAFHPQAVAQSEEASGRQSHWGITIFFTGSSVGIAAMSLAAAPLVEADGMHATALLVIPGLLVTGLFVRAYQSWYFRPLTQANAAGTGSAAVPVLPLSLLFAISVLRSAVAAAYLSFLPTLVVVKGGSYGLGGVALAAFVLSGSLGALLGGAAASRFGSDKTVLLSLVPAALATAPLPWLPTPLLLVALPLVGVCLFASEAQVIVLARRLMATAASLSASLMMGLGIGVGNLGAVAAGMLADRVSLPLALTWIALLLVGAVAAALAYLPATRGAPPAARYIASGRQTEMGVR
ncbi:MAG: MFS transporter [Chloroflexota bacterium]